MEEIILNISLTIIIVAILTAAIMYMIKAKKNGAKCIGCSAGGCCSHKKKTDLKNGGNCNCGCGGKKS